VLAGERVDAHAAEAFIAEAKDRGLANSHCEAPATPALTPGRLRTCGAVNAIAPPPPHWATARCCAGTCATEIEE
jgi:hypothetical protein